MLWAPYLHGHVLEGKKPLQSPSTTLLCLSLQPGKPCSHPTLEQGLILLKLPHSQPDHSILDWLQSILPILSSLLHSPLGTTAISSLGLPLPAGSSALFPSPAPSPHNMPTFPWWMPAQLSEQLYQEALSALSRGGDALDRVSCCLATSFSLLQQRFSLPVLLMQAQQMTAILLKQPLHRLLFMVIVVKGFVNISSLPSSVKADIILCFCSMPA